MFGINTTSSKYHQWYLCQISRTNHAVTCLYYDQRNFCNAQVFLFSRQIYVKPLTCFQPSLYTNLATSTCIFVQVWLSSKIFGIWNSRNLSAIFFNSASKGQVAMETVIFTCRYFKLSRNTTGLGQSDCRNFYDHNIT